MAPHQNKVFYDPEKVLPANTDSDSRSTAQKKTETIKKKERKLTIKMV